MAWTKNSLARTLPAGPWIVTWVHVDSPLTNLLKDTLVSETVREFERRLRARFGEDVLSVRMFGSFARGTAHEDSDVDVFVLLADAGYRERRDALDLASDLSLETGLLISPTIFDRDTYLAHRRQERPLVMAIERDSASS